MDAEGRDIVMEYLKAGDRIHIINKREAGRILKALKREGFLAEMRGEYIYIIEDRIGLRKNY